MDARRIEIEAADALLDVGVSLPLFRIRLPFARRSRSIRLTMRRPSLGSQIRIAKKYLSLGFTYEEMEAFSKEEELAFLAGHGKTVSEMVALTILRGYVSGWFYKPLAFVLRWFVRDEFLQGANLRFVSLVGTKSFENIIRFAEAYNPLKTSLSHEAKGS